ncbi:MAG: hypothetical protein ACQEWM_03795 [Actinomycetota bacterium]
MARDQDARDERNRSIVARYADGATLQEIGDDVGLTREAIRLIVRKVGGANAEASRAARQAAKEAAVRARREDFLQSFGDVAKDLADLGFTRAATVDRLAIMYPALEREVADDALKSSSLVFNYDNETDNFSSTALEAGIWYLLGSELRLRPDHAWGAVHLPQALFGELAIHLAAATVSAEDLATILGIVAAAQRAALHDPSLTITGSRYNELRGELLDAMGLESAKGARPWPPTRQTIMARYGGWSDALASMGLAIADRGRPKGMLVFDDEEYQRAASEFVAAAAANGTDPTHAHYGLWVKEEALRSIRRPSPASLRNYYGGWLNAVRAARPAADKHDVNAA